MSLTQEQEKAAKAVLARTQKSGSALTRLTGAVKTADSWTASLTALYVEAGIGELFGFTTVPTDAVAATRLRDIRDLLAKNRLGRLKDASQGLQTLLDATADGPLDPGQPGFWTLFLTSREQQDSQVLGEFVTELAVAHRSAARVLRSEVRDLLDANGLGDVSLETVRKQLAGEGVTLLEDLPSQAFHAVRAAGVNVVALVLPEQCGDMTHPRYTLGNARDGVVSVHDLGVGHLLSALRYYEQRGGGMATRKKAITQLRAVVSAQRPLDEVLVTYHLQVVATLKAEKKMTTTIRRELTDAGLDPDDVPRLLNEGPVPSAEPQKKRQAQPRRTPQKRTTAPKPRPTDVDRKNFGPVADLLDQKKLLAAAGLMQQLQDREIFPLVKYGSGIVDRYNSLAEDFLRDTRRLDKVNGDRSCDGVVTTLQVAEEIRGYCTDDPKTEDRYRKARHTWEDPAWRQTSGPASGLYRRVPALPPVGDTGPDFSDRGSQFRKLVVGSVVLGLVTGLLLGGAGLTGAIGTAFTTGLGVLVFGAVPVYLVPKLPVVTRKPGLLGLGGVWVLMVLVTVVGAPADIAVVIGLALSLVMGWRYSKADLRARRILAAQGTVGRWNNFVSEYDRRATDIHEATVRVVRIGQVGPAKEKRKCMMQTIYPVTLRGEAENRFLNNAASLAPGAFAVIEGKTVVAFLNGYTEQGLDTACGIIRAAAVEAG